jgi:hypothetical protein
MSGASPVHAEGAVGAEASGPAGDLAQLMGVQPAIAACRRTCEPAKADMVHVHVQAHADGVGGHQEVDLAGLVERRPGRCACAGLSEPMTTAGAAALAADQLGDGVDIVAEKATTGAPGRQAGQLLGAGVGQREKRSRGSGTRRRQQPPDQRAHGGRAQQHGLVRPARVQQAVGEDVAALRVGGQLDLVDRQEIDLAGQRHGLDGADEELRVRRDDLLLAGDQATERVPRSLTMRS